MVCADLKSWKDNPGQYWVNAPKEAQEFLVSAMGPFYEGKDQVQRDEAMRSCGIAAQTIMLAAKSMGYDSNPMIGFDPDKVAEIIKLPQESHNFNVNSSWKANKACNATWRADFH